MNFEIAFCFWKFLPICEFLSIIESLLVAYKFDGQQKVWLGIQNGI
jgi:hypothetical protein